MVQSRKVSSCLQIRVSMHTRYVLALRRGIQKTKVDSFWCKWKGRSECLQRAVDIFWAGSHLANRKCRMGLCLDFGHLHLLKFQNLDCSSGGYITQMPHASWGWGGAQWPPACDSGGGGSGGMAAVSGDCPQVATVMSAARVDQVGTTRRRPWRCRRRRGRGGCMWVPSGDQQPRQWHRWQGGGCQAVTTHRCRQQH